MDLLQIRYFQKVAEYQHMTKAAEALHIAQPSLSKTIRLLEEELGLPLFDRHGRVITLNDAGKIFLQYANIITNSVSDARQQLEEYRKTENATIHISQRVAPIWFPELIAEFHEMYPTVRFVVEQHQHLLSNYRKDTIDFVFFSSGEPTETASQKTILSERILLGVPLKHPFAEINEIEVEKLDGMDFIGSAPQESALRQSVEQYFRIANASPNFVLDCDDYMTVKEFVRTGVGLACIPEISWRANEAKDRIHYVNLKSPECFRHLNMAWKTGGYISKASKLFKEFAMHFYQERGRELMKEGKVR